MSERIPFNISSGACESSVKAEVLPQFAAELCIATRSGTDIYHPVNELVGTLISAINSAEFYPRLYDLLRELADWDSIVILSYHRDHPPLVLFEDLTPQDHESLYASYFKGAYLLSPFYLRWLEDDRRDELYRLQEIVPDGFFESIYYTDYYMGSGLRDEVAYLIPVTPVGTSVLLSLGRAEGMNAYSAKELDLLQSVKNIISSCVAKHTSLVMDSGRNRLSLQLSKKLTNFGAGILTDQEMRVVQFMLRGHSSKSCARALLISSTTERVHRRNIYAKMRISSQAELFVRFFDSLTMEPKQPKMKLA